MKTRRIVRVALSVAGLLATQSLFQAAVAEDKVVIKVADIFPTSHYILTEGAKAWMDKAVELGNGRIEFQHFPAQQLGKAKDILSLVQNGVAEVGAVAPAYVPEKLPLSVVGELPDMFQTACAGSLALSSLMAPGGILYEEEIKPQGVRVMFANMLAPYTVMTAEAELNSYQDLSGLKLYASGDAKHQTLTLLGATPIRLTGPEIYQAVERGTIDGAMLAYIGLPPYDLDSVMRYGLTGVNLGSTAVTYVMSEKAWTALPEDVQKILMEAGDYATRHLCEHSDEMNSRELANLKDKGAAVHEIAGSEADELRATILPVVDAWAKDLDDRGKPGSEAVKMYKEAVANL